MNNWTDEWDVTRQTILVHVKRLILPDVIVIILIIIAILRLGCSIAHAQPEIYSEIFAIPEKCWVTLPGYHGGVMFALMKEDIPAHRLLLDVIETEYRSVYFVIKGQHVIVHSEDIWIDQFNKKYIYQEFFYDYWIDGEIDVSSRRLLVENPDGTVLNQNDLTFRGFGEDGDEITDYHREKYKVLIDELINYHSQIGT